MNYRFHGLLSVLFLAIAVGISIISVLIVSSLVGLLYLVLLFVCFFVSLYFYCGGCSMQEHCPQVIMGKLARLLPFHRRAKRNLWDYVITASACLIVAALPQYYLFKIMPAFFLYWLLVGVAFVNFHVAVCRKCKNTGCPFRSSTK